MAPTLTSAFLFIASCALYWYLITKTSLLSTRYYLSLALLGTAGASGVWLILSLADAPLSIWRVLILVCVALVTLLMLSLFAIKLLVRTGDRMRSLHAYSRSFAEFDSPTRRFRLTTEDGISVQAVQLLNDEPFPIAIIVCHGAGRSKDIQANVITCELLAEQYDVFTFDWRGHQESAGFWTGDGVSKYDLKAMVEHVKSLGYEKIGVVGWSFGAWTAIIEGAEYHNFDALVAAAPPPGTLREAALAKQLFEIGFKWWSGPLRILLKAVRHFYAHRYDVDVSLGDVIGDLAPIPLLLVYNEFDTAIGVGEAEFQKLFDRAGSPKAYRVLKGKGHIYDWPNTFHYLNIVLDWLEGVF